MRDFDKMFGSGGLGGHDGATGNAIVAKAASRLQFSYEPSMTSATDNGTEFATDRVVDIPYVAQGFTLTKSQLESAAVRTSLAGAVSCRLAQIRNSQTLRQFTVDVPAAGQIQPPSTTSVSPVANVTGIPVTAGEGYEIAARYVDGSGNTPLSPLSQVMPANQMSQHAITNVIYVLENPIAQLQNAGTIPIASSTTELAFSLARKSDNKQTGLVNVPIGTAIAADIATITPLLTHNRAPSQGDYTNTGNHNDSAFELCFGVVLPNGQFLRTSQTTMSAYGRFYGNGWSQITNDDGDTIGFERSAIPQLLRLGSSGNAFLVVQAGFFWRPTGSSEWCQEVETSSGSGFTSGFVYLSQQKYNSSQKYSETSTVPANTVTTVNQIRVNWRSNSPSLGITNSSGNGALYNVLTFAKNTAGGWRQPKTKFYLDSISLERTEYLGIPSRDSEWWGSGSVVQLSLSGLPTKTLMDNAVNYDSTEQPKGDEFYTGSATVAYRASVTMNSNATRADFFVRKVFTAIDGSVTYGPWKAMPSADRVDAFTGTIRTVEGSDQSIATTNTTATYSGTLIGKLIWDNGAELVDFQPGDSFMLVAPQHNWQRVNVPAKLTISMDFNLKV